MNQKTNTKVKEILEIIESVAKDADTKGATLINSVKRKHTAPRDRAVYILAMYGLKRSTIANIMKWQEETSCLHAIKRCKSRMVNEESENERVEKLIIKNKIKIKDV